jgi:hypothetical protein
MGATAATLVLLCAGAQAQAPQVPPQNGDTVVGVGMICNTPDQARRFIALQVRGSEPHAAMNAVNNEAKDARACGVAAVAFVRDQTVDTETMNNKLVHVVRINVVAGYDGRGWQPVTNMTQYAVIEEGGESI